jgi:hypothetical protein
LGLLLAGSVALLLYVPWIPSLFGQTKEVRAGYWIPDVTGEEAKTLVLAWAAGLPDMPDALQWAYLAGLVLVIVWAVRRSEPAAWFFLLQAVVPWCGGLAFWFWTGESILQARYLVFAQLALFGLYGGVAGQLANALERVVVAIAVLCPFALGTWEFLGALPDRPPLVAQAAAALQSQYQPGDVVVVGRPGDVNRLRYYLKQAGMAEADVRWQPFRPQAGHTVHVASLEPDDFLWQPGPTPPRVRRIWRAFDVGLAPATPPDMELVSDQVFQGEGTFFLELYARPQIAVEAPPRNERHEP